MLPLVSVVFDILRNTYLINSDQSSAIMLSKGGSSVFPREVSVHCSEGNLFTIIDCLQISSFHLNYTVQESLSLAMI